MVWNIYPDLQGIAWDEYLPIKLGLAKVEALRKIAEQLERLNVREITSEEIRQKYLES